MEEKRMRRYFSRIDLIIFSIFLFFSASSRADQLSTHFIFFQDGLVELEKSEKQLAVDVWNEWVAQEGNYNLSTTVAPTMEGFLQSIKQKNVDLALLDGSNFIKYYSEIKSNIKGDVWAVQRAEKGYEEFVLLTRKGGKATELRKLKGTTISLYTEYSLLKMYLDYLVMKSAHTSTSDYFKVIRKTKTESHSILDVFFGYSDACLVAKHVFDNVIEMNPAIRDKIEIIHHSGEMFIPAIYFILNSGSKVTQARFTDAMYKLHNTVRGQQLMDLIGIHAINRIQQKKLFPMLEINSQVQQLTFE
jgi:ABC-type phosphate/phosphonate transport system substrate-binding protein